MVDMTRSAHQTRHASRAHEPRQVARRTDTMVDMTREAIQAITKELKQYRSPALNDKLYLHFKGWKKIEECLGEYSGVRALWLEGNGLRTLDNLGNLKELRCLYVQQNCLESLEGVEENGELDSINASNNCIKTVSGVAHLKRLNTLQLAHNRLATPEDVAHLAECRTIGVLDISNNKLEDPVVLDILAKMENLHVLQMQGNPVTRKIKHYRKTVIARCQKLTYLDDRPVFEDERRTVTAWACGGAGHKCGEGEVPTAENLYEALTEGSFDKNKAHEAEKEERKNIREEKEEKERRNREAFREMMLDARVRRIMQVLPNTRLLKGLSEAAIEELAHRMCQNPVHTNDVVGLAKDEAALACGSVVAGLYIITRGRVQLRKQGKPLSASGSSTLSSGQYFGEVALCTAHDQIATCDVVCSEYSEVYCLSKTALLEVADLYEGSLDVLQANRAQTLRTQWHECKPWRAYDLVPASAIKVNRSNGQASDDDRLLAALDSGAAEYAKWADKPKTASATGANAQAGATGWSDADDFVAELAAAQQSKNAWRMKPAARPAPAQAALMSLPSVVSWFTIRPCALAHLAPRAVAAPVAPAEYPREWYGKHELAKSVQVEGEDWKMHSSEDTVWDDEAFGSYHYHDKFGQETGIKIQGVDDEYNKQFARVQEARRKAFAEEAARRGCSVEEVAAETDRLARERQERIRAANAGEASDELDLPPLEDVDVTELQPGASSVARQSISQPASSVATSAASVSDDGPPELEDVDVSEVASGASTMRGFYGASDHDVLTQMGGQNERQFRTQYEKDNHQTQGEYNRELEATGAYRKAFSKKTEYKDAVEVEPRKIEVLEDEAPEPNFVPTFMAAPAFAGSRQGYVYKQGPAGLGYYRDDKNDDVAQTELQPAASSPNLEFAPAKTPEEEEGVTAYVAAAMKMQAEMECEPEGVATFGDGVCGGGNENAGGDGM